MTHTTLQPGDNRDMTADVDRVQRVLAKFSDAFLNRIAAGTAPRAPHCRWELARRAHETRRAQLLSSAHRNPTPAGDIRPGQVISEGHAMRALVRDTYRLPQSGRILLAVSYLSLVTGTPEDRVRELPLLADTDRSLHLVADTLTEVAPYAVALPEVTR